jgi:hypothetical protein
MLRTLDGIPSPINSFPAPLNRSSTGLSARSVAGKIPALAADFSSNRFFGPAFGPNLITNGTFDTDLTGWTTVFGTASVTNGKADVARGGGQAGRIAFPITCEVGETYRLSMYRDQNTSGSSVVTVAISSTSSSGAILDNSTGTAGNYEAYFVATQTNHWLFLRSGSGSDGDSALFDNVEIRKVSVNTPAAINPLTLFAATTERTSNATMWHNGVLKWGPHNLVPDTDLDIGPDWTEGGSIIRTDEGFVDGVQMYGLEDANASGFSFIRTSDLGLPASFAVTARMLVKKDPSPTSQFAARVSWDDGSARFSGITVNVDDGTTGDAVWDDGTVTRSVTEYSENLWLVEFTADVSGHDVADGSVFQIFPAHYDTGGSGAASNVGKHLVGNLRFYRSDLGGMAPAPDGTDYVSNTTGAARYLPRYGHTNPETGVKGVLVETDARTNLFRNNMWEGVALQSTSQTVGGITIDGSSGGVNFEVVASGEESGIPYIDVRVNGTNTSGGTVVLDVVDAGSVAASPGDQANVSAYLKLLSGAIPRDNAIQLYMHWRDAGDSLLTASSNLIGEDVGADLERFQHSSTAPASTTQIIKKGLYVRVLDTETVDFTFRIGGMQVEFVTAANPHASSLIPTSGATVTRNADTNGLAIDDALMPWSGTAFCVAFKGDADYGDEDDFTTLREIYWFEDADNNIEMALSTDSTNTGRVFAVMEDAATRNGSANTNPAQVTPGVGVSIREAARFTDAGLAQIALSGSAGLAVTVAGSFPADRLTSRFQIGQTYNGTISEVVVWAEDIGEAGIEGAST